MRQRKVTGKVEMEEAVPKFTRRASPIWPKNLSGFDCVLIRKIRGRIRRGSNRLPE